MFSLQELEIEYRISRLMNDYGRLLDDNLFDEWLTLFEGEDSRYFLHPRENVDAGLQGYWIYCKNKPMLRDRIHALKHANIYNIHYSRHILSGTRIVGQTAGIYDVRTNYCVIQTDVEGRSEVFSAGEYRDKVIFAIDGPRFKEKHVVPDTFNIQRPLAIPI